MEPHRLRAYILLLVVYAIWGTAGPVIKFTLGGLSPLLFLTYRFAISGLLGILIFLFTGFHFPRDRKTAALLLTYAFLTSTVSLSLLFFGLETTTVLDMTLITLVGPLLVSAAGVIYLKEHVTTREKFGMTIALVGTLFTVLEPLIQSANDGARLSGNILIFLSLFATIIPSIQAKIILRKEISPITMTNIAFIVGFLTTAPILFLRHPLPDLLSTLQNLPIQYHMGVIYMGVLSGTVAYMLANKAQKTIEVGEAAVFSYLYPIFATPLAVLWLHEKVTLPFIIGAFVISAGVIIAEYKKTRYN